MWAILIIQIQTQNIIVCNVTMVQIHLIVASYLQM